MRAKSRRRPSLHLSRHGHDSRTLRWFPVPAAERAMAIVIMLQIAALMVVGGGVTGVAGTCIITVFTLVVTLVLSFRRNIDLEKKPNLLTKLVLIGIVLLPIIQLIPLPPEIWQALPGQVLRKTALTLIGEGRSWQPISLTPLQTEYSILMSVSFSVLCMGLLNLSLSAFEAVIRFVVIVIMFGIFLGVAQVASGGASFRVYNHADHGALLGFFSNKNHMALAIASTIPLVALLTKSYDLDQLNKVWIYAGYTGIALLAIAMTNSRAGVALGILATVATATRALRRQKPLYLILGALGAAILALLLLTNPQVDALLNRFDSVGEDLRWRFAQQSVPLLHTFWVFGSGSGSFVRIFAQHEQLGWVKPTYVNHLHDDFYQLVIEQGILGVVLLMAAIFSLTRDGARNWRAFPKARTYLFSGAVVITLFLLHSIVDYPLRRPATFPLLAIAMVSMWRRYAINVDTR